MLTRALLLTLVPTAMLSAQGATTVVPVREMPPVVSASASAEAKFNPDRARINIAVQTRATTAAAAAADNAKKQSAVMTALRASGLANDQISTIGYNVNPEYRYPPNSSPTLIGYTVTNTVVAELRDLTQVGKVLDAALGSGANNVSSLEFYASNTDAPRQQAIGAAVQKARADAEVAAKAAGGSLGALIAMDVGGAQPQPPRPMYRVAMAAEAPAPPTPINPGEQTLTASVSMRWKFVPGR
ncbi:MAG TPA: SIMPL domain-containing protein [Candidatus Elarobacter sp.]|nr:SIMPL domain-containing protein [Candidatus Elarobacter sp.]